MERLINVEEARKNDIVVGAIEKETPCVLTRRTERGWQPCKSRFVTSPSATGRLLLRADDSVDLGSVAPLTPGERVGLTFRRGHKKCMCATIVLEPHIDVPEGDGTLAPCVELQWPQELQELQRRVYHRAEPPGRRVHVRFWPGGVAARTDAQNRERGVLSGAMLDLSAGGISILSNEISPDLFVEGDPVGCAFAPKPRAETLVLDATFRHVDSLPNGNFALGLQFVGLETSDRGRTLLSQLAGIVTDYQRGHARQQREKIAGRYART